MNTLRVVGWVACVGAGVLSLGCDGGPDPKTTGAAPDRVSQSPPVVRPAAQPQPPPPVVVTPEAANALRRIVEGRAVKGPWYLRVRILAGGCCGFLHKLDLDPEVSAEDRTFESRGVKVVVWERQVAMLRGTRVGYGVEGGKEGFTVKNPNFEGEALKKWLPVLQSDQQAK